MYSMTNVEPVSPASGYFGGKRNLVRRIVPLIDGDHTNAMPSRSSAWVASS